jgi:hypothetical protein
MLRRRWLTDEELEAHRVLDMAIAGFDVPDSVIGWALFVLGDGAGIGECLTW